MKCFVDGVALPRSAIFTDMGGTMYSGGMEPWSKLWMYGKKWETVGEATGVGGGADGVSAAGIEVSLMGVWVGLGDS